jgi:prepilin signal peptidase PulO-like enzyme (type II secretory pathway)
VTLVYAAMFGLAFGSFVNAAIERIPRSESLNGRSHCDGCKRDLRAWELIPVLSYLLLRGRCSSCSAAIGLRTPVVEIGCAAAFVASFAALPLPAAVALSAGFVGLVVAVGVALVKRGMQS